MVLSMQRWRGKVAIVTGASAGIGVSICEQLVKEGVLVVGLARRVELIENLAKTLQGQPGKLYALKCDVSQENDVLKSFKWTEDNVGPISILINNAGILQNTNLIDGDTEMWRKLLEVNILGLCVATREAVKNMRKNNIDGHIVHIGSVSGHMVNYFPTMNVYSASKFAVRSLTETLRQELNTINSKIRVTVVSPGCVKTEIFENNEIEFDRSGEAGKFEAMLDPEDCTDAVIYALSASPKCQVHDIILKPVGEKF